MQVGYLFGGADLLAGGIREFFTRGRRLGIKTDILFRLVDRFPDVLPTATTIAVGGTSPWCPLGPFYFLLALGAHSTRPLHSCRNIASGPHTADQAWASFHTEPCAGEADSDPGSLGIAFSQMVALASGPVQV